MNILLKPTIGEILIDNRKLEDKEIINWQKKIGFVPQNIILFNDKIEYICLIFGTRIVGNEVGVAAYIAVFVCIGVFVCVASCFLR